MPAKRSSYPAGSDNKTLMLADNINQGAGALQFDSNFTVVGKTTHGKGAGVIRSRRQTRLPGKSGQPQRRPASKLGAGNAYRHSTRHQTRATSASGNALSYCSKAASDGSKQAFNQVGITSGRGMSRPRRQPANQIRKPRFRLQGRTVSTSTATTLLFTHIRYADGGAQIVNHNPVRRDTDADLLTPSSVLSMSSGCNGATVRKATRRFTNTSTRTATS